MPYGCITLSEAADEMKVSYGYLYKLCRQGKIRGAIQEDGHWYVSKKGLREHNAARLVKRIRCHRRHKMLNPFERMKF